MGKTIVIMAGGFHPWHGGHTALYQSAQRAFPGAEVFVAATNDTSARPFPFAVKEKLAKLAGVAPGHFVQVKSPFRAEEITSKFDPARDRLIFVRSEKDANKPPQAGGVKRDGSAAYLQPLAGQTNIRPFKEHAYMAYLPTVEFGPGMTSATEIRTAWPQLDERRKTALVMSLYPKTQGNTKLAATVVKLLDAAIGANELNELRILHPVDNPGRIDVYYRPANTHSKQRRVVAKNIPYKGLELLTRAMVNKFNINPEDLEIVPVEQGVAENFADGRNPQDKGDAKRHGINTKASVSSLRKTAKQGGRKGQLAHWLANMKAGRAKKKSMSEGPDPNMWQIPLRIGKYLDPFSAEFENADDYLDSTDLIDDVEELIDAGVEPQIVTVNPEQLFATQDWLSNYGSDGALFDEYSDLPVIYKKANELYILDGHHRTSAALKKHTPIKVYLFEPKGISEDYLDE